MPVSVSDQFFTFDPAKPPVVGTKVDFTKFTLFDQNKDEVIDKSDEFAVDGIGVKASWPGDSVTIQVGNSGNVTYVGTTLYLNDGTVLFTPTDGQVLEAGSFVSSTYVTVQGPLVLKQLGPPCFLPGTHVATTNGYKTVEQLAVGDFVHTLDRGSAELKFVRKRHVSADHLINHPRHAPVCIPTSALGKGIPTTTLLVSPQHRVLLCSRTVERMFGVPEVLVPSAQLIGHRGIGRLKTTGSIEYIHLLFDHHAIVLSNGAPTESLYLGKNTIGELRREEYLEIQSRIGDINIVGMQPARAFASGKKLKNLLHRLTKNNKPLIDADYHEDQLIFEKAVNPSRVSA